MNGLDLSLIVKYERVQYGYTGKGLEEEEPLLVLSYEEPASITSGATLTSHTQHCGTCRPLMVTTAIVFQGFY